MKTAEAHLKMIRVSPRKLNLLAQAIRGMRIDKALTYLKYSPKRVANDVRKLVLSALSNAENNSGLDIDRLYVREAYVGKNITMRRFNPRAKGRAAPINKPFSQMSVILEEKEV
jgi:large subunit ribosomal protein L22